jgi:hypothetical protein
VATKIWAQEVLSLAARTGSDLEQSPALDKRLTKITPQVEFCLHGIKSSRMILT